MVAANDVIGWLLVIGKIIGKKKETRDRVLPKVYAILGSPHEKPKKPLRFLRTWLVFFFFRVKVLPVYAVCFGLEST